MKACTALLLGALLPSSFALPLDLHAGHRLATPHTHDIEAKLQDVVSPFPEEHHHHLESSDAHDGRHGLYKREGWNTLDTVLLGNSKAQYYKLSFGLVQDAGGDFIRTEAKLLPKLQAYKAAIAKGLIKASGSETTESDFLISVLSNPATKGMRWTDLEAFARDYEHSAQVASEDVAAARITAFNFLLQRYESMSLDGQLARLGSNLPIKAGELQELQELSEDLLSKVSLAPKAKEGKCTIC